MGRSGLSSKRKHSKKKSLKDSSEGRRKKRSSRNKSKKLHRHDDSFSSSSSDDDDASTSSSLVSSSSSEGEHRSRRARSHTRSEVKGSSRKRSRRRSLSQESGKDSPLLKKRKRSKKKGDSETKKKNKKIKKKKKSRRDAYISSDSAGCSTCGDGNSSSDEGESLGRRRSRSREKKKNHKDSIKGRKGHRKNRSRSRSSSPSKLSNSFDDEKVIVENNSRRLKSIITVAKPLENEEENDMKRDELKEEIFYDYDDYPSCKSNDSNDGESKKELVDCSTVSPERKRMLTSVIGEVNSSSSLKDNKPMSPSKNLETEINASGNIGSEVDNLESILRQKALENLSRFRGGLQTKTVVSVDNKHKSDQIGVKQSIIQTPMAVPQPVIPRSRFTWRRDPSVITTGKEEKAAIDTGTESGKSQAPKPKPKLQTANLSSTLSVENKISKVMENSGNDIGGIETNDGRKATTTGLENKEGSSSKEQQTESNNSQFEKKTMSVMRGGEMVQVSYKVYIPTRAPALARRQLKR